MIQLYTERHLDYYVLVMNGVLYGINIPRYVETKEELNWFHRDRCNEEVPLEDYGFEKLQERMIKYGIKDFFMFQKELKAYKPLNIFQKVYAAYKRDGLDFFMFAWFGFCSFVFGVFGFVFLVLGFIEKDIIMGLSFAAIFFFGSYIIGWGTRDMFRLSRKKYG
jgi:hypothetical protein